jgi:hypothetical protein
MYQSTYQLFLKRNGKQKTISSKAKANCEGHHVILELIVEEAGNQRSELVEFTHEEFLPFLTKLREISQSLK